MVITPELIISGVSTVWAIISTLFLRNEAKKVAVGDKVLDAIVTGVEIYSNVSGHDEVKRVIAQTSNKLNAADDVFKVVKKLTDKR